MGNDKSVVTEERYQQGYTYEEFIDKINVNKDRFDQYYGTAADAITVEDKEFFKKAVQQDGGVARVLVLGEDWCPDVYRGMPLMARIAEASGMEIKIFPRDENLDIMNEFLNHGEHQSIPTFVFYTSTQEYLFHWIERPSVANEETAAIDKQIEKDMAGRDEQEVRRARRDKVNAKFPDWQKATVIEIKDLVAKVIGS